MSMLDAIFAYFTNEPAPFQCP